jgi:hypothetical protein
MTTHGVDGWSDERLAAALRDRAAVRVTPHHLEGTTMSRLRTTRTDGTARQRFAWAGALAATIAVVVFLGSALVTSQPPSQAASPSAAGVAGTPSGASSPSEAPTPRVITLEFPSGPHRNIVEVVDESGRLTRVEPASRGPMLAPPPPTIVATGVERQPNQIQITWTGGGCDRAMRMTIRPDARTVDITDAGARGIDTGSLCMLGSFERALILTFDGPARAEDFEFVGQPPRPVMTPLTD